MKDLEEKNLRISCFKLELLSNTYFLFVKNANSIAAKLAIAFDAKAESPTSSFRTINVKILR
ncbi:hypothetical protein RFY41_07120, partial [Acinetobacter soli]|nr:hypothetical protein [Acinetobacter soli]